VVVTSGVVVTVAKGVVEIVVHANGVDVIVAGGVVVAVDGALAQQVFVQQVSPLGFPQGMTPGLIIKPRGHLKLEQVVKG